MLPGVGFADAFAGIGTADLSLFTATPLLDEAIVSLKNHLKTRQEI
jgi:hypothetical protein